MSPGRRWALAAGAVAALTVALAPDAALAHGLVGRQDLPIPRWLFAWGAAAVLVVSFVALTVLWPRARLEGASERRVLRVPVALEVLCGAVGVVAFAAVVYAGFAGTQTGTANLAPTVIYVLFWVGLPVLSVLGGDVFAAFNPWRALARAAAWIAARGGARLPAPMPYPPRLGHWPAALGILAFVWVELVYRGRDDPSSLAVLALVYAAIQLVGMSLYGIGPWTRAADAFAVYFHLFSLLSPLHWRRRTLVSRPPLAGATRLAAGAGTVALLCVMIGTTSFDGFSQSELWASQIAPDLLGRFVDLGFSQQTALELTFTIGLLGAVGFVSGLYRLGALGMRSVGGGHGAGELAARFAHSLVPIALAYVVAHYFSLLVYQGQAIAFLVSDPLGDGSDLFGTASATIDYRAIGATAIWYVQVAALVIGHVAGLTLAHDRALVLYRRVRDASRSQYWMLAVMIAFTSLGLFLLSAAAQA